MSKIKKFKRIKQFRKYQAKLALMALAMSNLAYADLTTGLVAYYPFTGNANDASGNGNNGTVYGTTLTADRNGNANSAYSFDGVDDYIYFGQVLPDMTEMSISFYVKTAANNGNSIVFGDADWAGGNDVTLAIPSDSSIQIRSDKNDYNLHDTLDIGINILNSWHHVVWIMTAIESKLYVDGMLKATVNKGGSNVGYHNFILGTLEYPEGSIGWLGYWQGILTNLRIYNRALSATEIQQLYQEGTPQTTTTLASSLNPAALGQNIIFTGKVTAATVPNGNLTFKIDGSTKYSNNLTNGQLTYATNTLTAGAHTIRAEYVGTTTFAASSAQLTQTITSKPDLIVTAVNLTPPQPTVGNTFTATVTIKNQGGGGDGGQLRLWTNQPTIQLCAASGGDKTLAVGSVAAGASKTLTFTGLNPGVKGAKILRAFVDAACTVAETNDTNNQLVKGYMVKDLRADFVVTALTLTPASPTANNLFTVSATVKNQGMAARAAGYLDVWLNKPTAPGCSAADNDDWIDIGTLAAGASKTVTLSMVADTAGTKTARAYIDSWCETMEANEANNQLIKSYVVQ